MAKVCDMCKGSGKLGFQQESCWYCNGIGYIKQVPKECYEEFGEDLDKCSTQQNEGCGRCSLYK